MIFFIKTPFENVLFRAILFTVDIIPYYTCFFNSLIALEYEKGISVQKLVIRNPIGMNCCQQVFVKLRLRAKDNIVAANKNMSKGAF